MLNSNDVSEYLKISPTGLEVRSLFRSLLCCTNLWKGAGDYPFMELFIQSNIHCLLVHTEGDEIELITMSKIEIMLLPDIV